MDVPDKGSVLKPDVDPTATATPVDEDAPQPDLDKTASAFESMRSLSISMAVLTTLAVFYTLYFARAFLLPIAFAVLLNFLFSPFVRWMSRLRIPHPMGAGVVILGLIAIIGLAGYELTSPVQHWATQAPETMRNAEAKLRELIRPLQDASKTAEQVANAASATTETTATGKTVPTPVVVQGPTLLAKAFGTTTKAAAAILEVVILLFFLLASGDLFLQKLIKVLPNLGEKRKAVQIARETEASISRYLLTAAVINAGEAAIVTGVMYLFHMPSPFLWGALVLCLEFIPYLGAFTMCVILTVAAVTTYDSVGHALLVPASFLLINLIQGNLVSPTLLGHRLSLNPVAIFIGLAFWFTVWGIPGAFVAVPMLAAFKIFCDHIESLASVGEFLGRRDDLERRATIREGDAASQPA
jgi:predicted PurR-regulated permease PerM